MPERAKGESRRHAGSRRRWLLLALVVVALGIVVAVVNWQRPGVGRYPVRGIDVSHHQGEIDWDAVARGGVRFAYIKASEGRDHRDTRFERNWSHAERVGLARGAYHFFTFCSPGSAQAEHFLEVIAPTTGTLPPVVDVEFAGNCKSWTSIEDIRAQLRDFLTRIEAAWGRRPLLYVTSESERRIIAGHFDAYPIWIRNVFWRPRSGEPEWLFWQFSDDSEVVGIETPVDMNVYRGALEELAVLVR